MMTHSTEEQHKDGCPFDLKHHTRMYMRHIKAPVRLTIGFGQSKVNPHGSCKGNDCVQPEGTRSSDELNERQKGLTHCSIGDPVTGGGCSAP